MSVTKKQVAEQLALIAKSEEKEKLHSRGWTAVQRIVQSLLRGGPEFITSRPNECQTSIADWCDRYKVVFKDLPPSADDATIRIEVDHHYNPIIDKMAIKGDNLIVSLKYSMTVSVVNTRMKTVWKNIDEDTRKRVPVLDDQNQPVFEKLPPQNTTSKIIGKMTVPVDFFVDLLNEIERDSLMEPPPENYVPPVIGGPDERVGRRWHSPRPRADDARVLAHDADGAAHAGQQRRLRSFPLRGSGLCS